jgi:hypothetical protein
MVILFSGFRDDMLKQQIIDAGGKVVTTITKNTNNIIAKKDGKASKKLDEAKEKNINIIFLEDFIEEHEFSLAEKKIKAEKVEKTEKVEKPEKSEKVDKPKTDFKNPEYDYKIDIDLMSMVMRGLSTQSRADKLVALSALRDLQTRIKLSMDNDN